MRVASNDFFADMGVALRFASVTYVYVRSRQQMLVRLDLLVSKNRQILFPIKFGDSMLVL